MCSNIRNSLKIPFLFALAVTLTACGGGDDSDTGARSSSSVRSSSSSSVSSSSVSSSSSSSVSSSASSSSSVTENIPPNANAGPNAAESRGSVITLNGSGTEDTDGTITSFLWEQTLGPSVSLSSNTEQNPTFTVPADGNTSRLIFELTVTDDDGAQDSDSVVVTVFSISTPPVLVEEHSVTVSWNAPTTRENGDPLPNGELGTYHVRYTNISTNSATTEPVDGAETSTELDNIPTGSYRFEVALEDSDGLMSDYSDAVTININ